MKYVRGHGLGNDYLVMRAADLPWALTPRGIRAICDRHRGVGSDGIVLVLPPRRRGTDARLRIFNPDGSEAEKSGNGIRIAAKTMYDYGWVPLRTMRLETAGGVVRAALAVARGRVRSLVVDMGAASFRSRDIGLTGPSRDTSRLSVDLDGRRLDATAVSVGNPHCVVWVPRAAAAPVAEWGPRLESHPWFRHRTNVQFAEVRSRRAVAIRIWERGAGVTEASGSSASAVAAACVRRGFTGRKVAVLMPGGTLHLEIRAGWQVRLEGPAEEISRGEVSGELLDRLKRAGG